MAEDERERDDGQRHGETVGGRPDGERADVVDAVFDAVADEDRRLALYYLRDRRSVGLDELATVVAGWRQARASATGQVTPEDRDRVLIALQHVHLPRLADAGFVRYDADAQQVTLDRAPDVLYSILERVLADERRGIAPFGDDGESGGDAA